MGTISFSVTDEQRKKYMDMHPVTRQKLLSSMRYLFLKGIGEFESS